jgi:hypothetical protein
LVENNSSSILARTRGSVFLGRRRRVIGERWSIIYTPPPLTTSKMGVIEERRATDTIPRNRNDTSNKKCFAGR